MLGFQPGPLGPYCSSQTAIEGGRGGHESKEEGEWGQGERWRGWSPTRPAGSNRAGGNTHSGARHVTQCMEMLRPKPLEATQDRSRPGSAIPDCPPPLSRHIRTTIPPRRCSAGPPLWGNILVLAASWGCLTQRVTGLPWIISSFQQNGRSRSPQPGFNSIGIPQLSWARRICTEEGPRRNQTLREESRPPQPRLSQQAATPAGTSQVSPPFFQPLRIHL